MIDLKNINPWKVSSNYIPGIGRFWEVYRTLRAGDVDHSGNREYRGGPFKTEAEAQEYAAVLNLESKTWRAKDGDPGDG